MSPLHFSHIFLLFLLLHKKIFASEIALVVTSVHDTDLFLFTTCPVMIDESSEVF